MVHHVGRRFAKDCEGKLEPATEIGHQHFDACGGGMLAYGAYAIHEMPCSAVAQVVAVHAGYDNVFESQSRYRPSKIQRFLGIGRERPPMPHVTERTAAGTQVAGEHECRGALPETLSDIGAGSLLAYRMQAMVSQNALDLREARTMTGLHTYPLGLAQRFNRHDLDRDARRLTAPFLFLSDDAHGSARNRLSANLLLSTSMASTIPTSRNCVTR